MRIERCWTSSGYIASSGIELDWKSTSVRPSDLTTHSASGITDQGEIVLSTADVNSVVKGG